MNNSTQIQEEGLEGEICIKVCIVSSQARVFLFVQGNLESSTLRSEAPPPKESAV